MKRILLCVLCLALTACAAPKKPEPAPPLSSAPGPAPDLREWEALRRELPKSCQAPDVLVTPAMAQYPEEAPAIAEALAGGLALFPAVGEDFGPEDPADPDQLLTFACFAADGTPVGSPEGGGRLTAQVDAMLGHPGILLTKEQVDWAARWYFGEDVTLEHHSTPADREAPFRYLYYEELGVYAYPEDPVPWTVPYVIDLWIDGDYAECYYVPVQYSRQGESTGFAAWNGEEVARWELDRHMMDSYSHYDEYFARLDLSGPRPVIIGAGHSRSAVPAP